MPCRGARLESMKAMLALSAASILFRQASPVIEQLVTTVKTLIRVKFYVVIRTSLLN